MKLALKFTLSIVLAMILVLSLITYFQIRREISLYEQDIQRDHLSSGRGMGKAVGYIWQTSGLEKAMETVKNATRPQDFVQVRWVWLDQSSLDGGYHQLPPEDVELLKKGQEVYWIPPHKPGQGQIFTYVPIPGPPGRHAALELSESLEPERIFVSEIIRAGVLKTLLVILISGVITVVLGLSLVGRPIAQLVDKARRIGAGDFFSPLEIQGRDEMRDLAREINFMSRRLAETRENLTKETEARLAALEQLRHADRLMTVGKLASGIAHELGTPLNVISARAKMIMTDEEKGEEAKHSASVIHQQAGRMTQIIRQLLDFSRRRTPIKTWTGVRDICGPTLEMLQPMARKTGIDLRASGDENSPRVYADPNQIQQVLANLLMNGIHAMKKGGNLLVDWGIRRTQPPPSIGGPERDFTCIRVVDQGEGIPSKDLDHIFDPFFTTKDVGEGTGLGLAVAHGIVTDHGGWITVQSEPGRGSIFSVYLPLEGG